MKYQTIPRYIHAHLFNGDIQALQQFIDEFAEPVQTDGPENTDKQPIAYAMELPNPQFKDDAIIVRADESNATSLKIKVGQYIEHTDWGFFQAINADDFESQWQLAKGK